MDAMIGQGMRDIQTALLTSTMQNLLHNCVRCLHGFEDPDSFLKHLADHAGDVKRQFERAPDAIDMSDTLENYSDIAKDADEHIPANVQDKKSESENYSKGMMIRSDHVQEGKIIEESINHNVIGEIHQTLPQTKRTYVCFKCNVHFLNDREKYEIHCAQNHRLFEYKYQECPHQLYQHHQLRIRMQLDTAGQFSMCPYCNKKLKETSLKAHFQKVHCKGFHSEIGTYHCKLCTDKFEKECHLSCHIFKKHDACVLCNNYFPHSNHLLQHLGEAHGLSPYTCRQCASSAFRSKKDLLMHKASVHTDGLEFRCKTCDDVFFSQTALENHEREHRRQAKLKKSAASIIKCHVCKITFEGPENLSEHIKSHENLDQYDKLECLLCTSFFVNDRRKLQVHLKTNHAEMQNVADGKHSCALCESKFHDEKHLELHAYALHYQCKYCPKYYKTLGELHIHKGKSHGLSTLQCSRCVGEFQTKEELKNHMSEKHLKCTTCDKVFGSHSNLEIHKKQVHVLKHCCKICNEGFKLKKNLQLHMQSAHGGYKCSNCNKAFQGIYQLKRHEQICKAKQLACDICKENFRVKKDLESHMESSHGGFRCSICLKVYKKKSIRNMHMKQHFGIKKKKVWTGKKRFVQCHFCGRKMKYEYLKRHVQAMHSSKTYDCEICSKTFKWKNHYNEHVRGHTEGPYPCDVCGKLFQNKIDIRSHLYTHKEKLMVKKHSCSVCDKSFSKPSKLKRHLLTHNKCPKNLKQLEMCKICSKVIQDNHHRIIHQVSHFQLRPFFCEECGYRFSHNSALNQHKRDGSHTKNKKLWNCATCLKWFENESELRSHVQQHEGSNSFVCSQCGIGETSLFRLLDHISDHYVNSEWNEAPAPSNVRSQTDNRLYACGVCGKTYYSERDLQRHSSIHNGHTCSKCNSHFELKKELNRHMLEVHNIKKEALFVCAICGKSYNLRSSIQSHMIRHGEKKFPCDICGKSFFQPSELEAHRNRHNKDTFKFSCEWCGKGFQVEYELKLHIAALHGINKVEMNKTWCDICQKMFPTRTYNKHKVKHLDVKPHVCKICGKGFGYSWTLKLHMPEHTGQYAHKCTECEESFRYKYQLQKHMENEHDIEPQKKPERKVLSKKCKICDSVFKTKSQLDKHMAGEHSEEAVIQIRTLQKKSELDNPELKEQGEESVGQRKSGRKRKTFQCEVCDETFAYKYQYENHLLDEHDDE